MARRDDLPQKEVGAMVRWAYDSGVTYFDLAPTYGDVDRQFCLLAEKRVWLARHRQGTSDWHCCHRHQSHGENLPVKWATSA